MTQEELAQAIDRAVGGFSSLEGVEVELAERLVEEGFLSYDDLSIIEPDALMAMGNLSEETTNLIVEQAEERAEVAEAAAAEARRQKREQERLAEMAAEAGMKLAPIAEEGRADESSDETVSEQFDTQVLDQTAEDEFSEQQSAGTESEENHGAGDGNDESADGHGGDEEEQESSRERSESTT
jgi:N utilization substance protein A